MRASAFSPARHGAARAAVATLAPLVATAVGVFANGGYARSERLWFSACAVVALVVTAWAAPPLRVPRALVGVLLALAGLAALSTLWTIGLRSESLVWAATAAGYAAVLVAAATAGVLPGGVLRLAAGCALIVTIASLLGLVSAALGEPGFANRIAGVWRPGGPFQYPPALALVQTAALPALLAAAVSERRALAFLSAAGCVVAAGVLALSASRTGLALGLMTAGAWALTARGRGAASGPRAEALAVLAVAAAAGVTMAAVARSGEGVRLAVLAAAVALAGTVCLAAPRWLVVRGGGAAPGDSAEARGGAAIGRARGPEVARGGAARVLMRGRAGGVAVVIVAAVLGAVAFGGAAGRGDGPATDVLHGRGHLWGAALDTFADRPVKGAGAGAFLTASARHQDGQTIAFAHNLPLELAAELGVLGLALVLALYATNLRALVMAPGRSSRLLTGPMSVAFLTSNLVDWPWHLAGAGALWAVATGALVGEVRSAPTSKGLG